MPSLEAVREEWRQRACGRMLSGVDGGNAVVETPTRPIRRGLKWMSLIAGLLGSGIGIFYLARFVMAAVLFSSIVGSSGISEDRAANGRGDEATASTEASGNWGDPDKTVVRLRRAYHWFSTTLVETESFGVHEDLKWRNDDALEVMLDFGCLTHITRPVDKVGSIRISYHQRRRPSTRQRLSRLKSGSGSNVVSLISLKRVITIGKWLECVALTASSLWRHGLQKETLTPAYSLQKQGRQGLHFGVGAVLPDVEDVFRVDNVALLVPRQRTDHRLCCHRVQCL
jgi:hypothetical protein